MERLSACPIIPGQGEGLALVTTEALSFWGDVDPSTGIVQNARHPLHGERLGGRVLVFPWGRGSCTTSNILLELVRTGCAPAAIINRTVEPVLAVGPLVGEVLYGRTIPIVTLEAEAFSRIQTGDWITVDAARGEVYRRAA